MFYKKCFAFFCMCFLSSGLMGASSCVQTENSNTNDAGRYAPIDADSAFAPVSAVLRASCASTSCHGGTWALLNETDMAAYMVGAQRLVTPGDAVTSLLYDRLTNVTTGTGVKNMPLGGSALTDAEITAIKTWIDGLPAATLAQKSNWQMNEAGYDEFSESHHREDLDVRGPDSYYEDSYSYGEDSYNDAPKANFYYPQGLESDVSPARGYGRDAADFGSGRYR